MKAYVPTPDALADLMAEKLFAINPPGKQSWVLDAGCGSGALLAGIVRWCNKHRVSIPKMIGIERNPSLVAKARERFAGLPQIKIECADYLRRDSDLKYSHIIANPPYVSVLGLTEKERDRYRESYGSAKRRFDLYMLFFERALEQLATDGALVFVTPEKYLYVESGEAIRRILSRKSVESIILLPEDSFPDITSYPAITVLRNKPPTGKTTVLHRDGKRSVFEVPTNGEAWWPYIQGETNQSTYQTLEECSVRVSVGVATGADSVYLVEKEKLPKELRRFAIEALAGRDLETANGKLPVPRRYIISPYDSNGRALPEEKLGALGEYLGKEPNRTKLKARTSAKRKEWYLFHDSFPVGEMRKPKIVCKDISAKPKFWIDDKGIVPLHSIYYVVPQANVDIQKLCDWLNGPETAQWLQRNCQRAANGFCRVQSHVLKRVPIAPKVLSTKRKTAG